MGLYFANGIWKLFFLFPLKSWTELSRDKILMDLFLKSLQDFLHCRRCKNSKYTPLLVSFINELNWYFFLSLCSDLSRNFLNGSIPPEWGALPLKKLYVYMLVSVHIHFKSVHKSVEWFVGWWNAVPYLETE